MRRGRALELQVDGTSASVYRPGRVTTGSVWDAIAAGLLALPPARRRELLLLGLGGGSAARLARALAPDARIVGVELEPEVVATARAHLDLDAIGLEVVIDDARHFLARSRERFDAIFEDVFVGEGRDAYKPDGFPVPAVAQARRRLRAGGILVTNAIDEAPAVGREVVRVFGHAVRIEIEDYDNRVFVARKGKALSAHELRAAVAADPTLRETLPLLRFRSWGG